MNILLIGSGGREHALAWAISKSPLLTKLYCAPGNGGISDIAQCVQLDPGDHGAVRAFCKDNNVSFVVIGPEAPLVAGLGDALRNDGLDVFGPSAAAAQLEGSKAYTKELCAEFNIPTAAFARFTDAPAAKSYVRSHGAPIVIKADGLAAGKGVVMAETVAEAEAAIDACLAGEFGDGGTELIVEDLMVGEEASFFALVDGKVALPLATAQDHKRAHDGDTGPNTGGMGAYSPAPVMTDELCTQAMNEIIMPTVRAMANRGTPFHGVLYAGLMITDTGPKLIEYNIRFGDPECQVLMMRLKSDIVPALLATSTGELSGINLQWHDDTALTVVMAANGYPGTYQKGTPITGLSQVAENSDCTVFHAGTARDGDAITAIGGRVLNVTARAATVSAARDRAYDCVSQINWPDGFYRRDIGYRAIARESAE